MIGGEKNMDLILIKDLIKEDIKKEQDICKLVQYYPNRTILLVTPKQKGFFSKELPGWMVRYIDLTGKPFYSDKPTLVWENPETSREYLVMTALDIDRFGAEKK